MMDSMLPLGLVLEGCYPGKVKPLIIQVPDDFLDLSGWSEGEAQVAATQSLVMELVRRNRISTGRAAELLGISRWEIDSVLAAYNVDVVDWDPADLA